MKVSWSKTARRGAVLGAAASLAALGFAAPAFASTPGTGNASYNGTISLTQETIAMTLGLTDFTLNSSNTVTNGPVVGDPMGPGGGHVVVSSNDAAGYFMDEAGPAAFTGAGSNTFDTNNVSASIIQYTTPGHGNNAWATLPTASQSPLVVASSSVVSGSWDLLHNGGGVDSFDLNGWGLNSVPGNTPPDTYTGTVALTLWGN